MSKNFEKTNKHRSNYIRWAVNRLNLNGVQKINLERIKHLRRGKKSSRLLSHWNYADTVQQKHVDVNVSSQGKTTILTGFLRQPLTSGEQNSGRNGDDPPPSADGQPAMHTSNGAHKKMAEGHSRSRQMPQKGCKRLIT